MLETFKAFLADDEAWDMYIHGPAGTGKTTSLHEGVKYCIDQDIPYVVCAFTHKACGILRGKLPQGARVQTLHSFLKKRPFINTNATNVDHVNSTVKAGATDADPKVLFLDEFSMIGEKDYLDIVAAQDPEYEGAPDLKVVWIGDPHQLPPVGDAPAVLVSGDYVVRLTKIWRNDNPLQQPLTKLIGMIEGDELEPLEAVPGYFERGINIVEAYEQDPADKVILAYTNRKVEELNLDLAGKPLPEPGDRLFSPSSNQFYEFAAPVEPEDIAWISIHYSDPLGLGSKYKTLEYLVSSGLCNFAQVYDEDGEEHIFAYTFGHYQYKMQREQLERAAVEANQAIEREFQGYKAAAWAKANPKHELARHRAKAWRDCLSFKDCVVCLDFPYAMTVHKSQGSTYEHVYIDTDDLAIAANRDVAMYVKLMYVAISRASKKVITC
jgi:hypothetical protein